MTWTNYEAEAPPNTTYNGWTNRETWVVNLWLSNDESESKWLDELANDGREIYDQARALEEYIQEAWQDLLEFQKIESSIWADLMTTALWAVDWREIIEAHQEDE